MERPSLTPGPVFQCPGCKTPTDKFPCPSCGRKLTESEKEAHQNLINRAGGLDVLRHIHRQAELDEFIQKAEYHCPGCGRKCDEFPCAVCTHMLTDKEKEDFEQRKTIIRAAQEYKRMDAVNHDGIQFGKRMGTRDANGELIDKGGCLLLIISLSGILFSALLGWLIE